MPDTANDLAIGAAVQTAQEEEKGRMTTQLGAEERLGMVACKTLLGQITK